ncbi:hypothetical protein AVEN_217505-1, partial [Araneus ventricosus]
DRRKMTMKIIPEYYCLHSTHSHLYPVLVSASTYLKLDIHLKTVLVHLEGFLAGRFHFQPIKFGGLFTGQTVPPGNPSPTGNAMP